MRCFDYVVKAQLDEFQRLYGATPQRVDGHHHMHLCANVVLGGLLPPGTLVRRNHSFQPGEKGLVNRKYRQLVDGLLARRHRLVDLFLPLKPLDPASLDRLFALSLHFVVEAATHPATDADYRFLMGRQMLSRVADFPIARGFAAPKQNITPSHCALPGKPGLLS
jgi:hypothetical protein